MIYTFGSIDVLGINSQNIPVNVSIREYSFDEYVDTFGFSPFDDIDDDTDFEDIKNSDIVYALTACNFMPRKEIVINAYHFMSTSKQELIDLVQTNIKPLYEAALNNIVNTSQNYFWENNLIKKEIL